MNTKKIELYDIPLEVNYYYKEGIVSGDRDVPDDPDYFSIQEVFLEGFDILPLVSSRAEELVKEKILNR